jgi:hypothetical protein
MIERDKVVNSLGEEGVVFFGEHEVVRYADRDGFRQNDWVDQEWVKGAQAPYIQV